MAIIAFDIGGTSVKYGLWDKGTLCEKGFFATPHTWIDLKEDFKHVVKHFALSAKIEGVGFSFPGAVDSNAGKIDGSSAIPYIHHFPLKEELERELLLPISLENDAKCAALAEMWQGAAKDVSNALFVVIGSGIGGAVIVNHEIVKGINLFGGEFGYMLLNKKDTFSYLASPVHAAARYRKQSGQAVTGVELFQRAEAGDDIARQEVDGMQRALAQGLHNLLVCFNPERIIIGGAISAREGYIEEVTSLTRSLIRQTNADDVKVEIVPCQFHNDANLVGAVAAFLHTV